MIAYLTGTLFHQKGDEAIVLCAGVGYLLRLPTPTAGALGAEGSQVSLWVHTAVKEDALDLYGFASARQRSLFQLLLEVPNVGPKLALLLMSSVPPAVLAKAVQQGDIPTLTRVKGIGKKTAEALLFHLKDRALEVAAMATEGIGVAVAIERPAAPADDLLAALLALGYRPAQAEAAAAQAREKSPGGGLEVLVREALKALR
jgi:Holliday junction DNA helicase RuvA